MTTESSSALYPADGSARELTGVDLASLPSYGMALMYLGASWGEFSRLRWLGLGDEAVPVIYGAVAAAWIGLFLALWRRGVRSLARPVDRTLCAACALLVVTACASAAGAVDPSRALQSAFELAGSAALLIAAVSLDRARLMRALSRAALLSIAVNALLCVAGLGCFGLLGRSAWPYQVSVHQHLGTLPRFYGLGVTPFGLGVSMFANIGLIETWPHARVRRWATAAALFMTLISLSFCTLLLPVLWFARRERRTLRRVGLAVTLTAALATLYLHPIALHVGGREIALGELHPHYHDQGRGPVHMPLHVLRVPGASFVYHFTAYYYLARRGLACGLERPWLGVGGRNAPLSCRAWIMDTYGTWHNYGRLHNEYVSLWAELGLAGVAAACVIVCVLRRRYEVAHAQPWRCAALLALLGSAFAMRALLHVPSLMLLASSLGSSARAAGASGKVNAPAACSSSRQGRN